MTFQNYGDLPDDQQTPGSTAFLHSQVVYPDAQGTPVNEYWELDGKQGLGAGSLLDTWPGSFLT